MGQARRARSIAAYFPPSALEFQGITPGVHGLASLKSLRMFCPQLAVSRSLLDEDELPADVRGPADLDMDQAIRNIIDSRASPFLSFVSTAIRAPMVRWNTHPLHSPFGRNARIGDLIDSSCRLIR